MDAAASAEAPPAPEEEDPEALPAPLRRKEQRKTTAPKLLAKVSDDNDEANGVLIDYIYRITGVQSLLMQGQGQFLLTVLRRLLVAIATQDFNAYASACQTLNSERIASAIMHDVNVFWKAAGHPKWCCDARTTLRQAGWLVAKKKMQAVQLKAEVDMWAMHHHTLNHMRTKQDQLGKLENKAGKLERLSNFWAQFHGGYRSEAPRPTSPDPTERPTSAGPQRVRAADGTKSKFRAADLQWETRAARSGSSAGTWDWTKSAPSSATLRSNHLVAADSELERTASSDPSRQSFAQKALLESSPVQKGEERRGSSKRRSRFILQEPRPTPEKPRPSTKLRHAMVRRPASATNLHSKVPADSQRLETGATFHALAALVDGDYVGAAVLPRDQPVDVSREPACIDSSPKRSLSLSSLRRRAEDPSQQYLAECRRNNAIPAANSFAIGHSTKISSLGLTDIELTAMTAVVRVTGVSEVDLGGNTQLSELVLARFLEALIKGPSSAMTRLSLKRCLRAGHSSITTVVRLLQDSTRSRKLQHLDLSGIRLGIRLHLPLCEAVQAHDLLQTLRLAECGLGHCDTPKECISALISCRSIRTLDIGWNSFTVSVLVHLGQCLAASRTLQSLGIANCTTASTEITPLAYFLEQVTSTTPLTHLDISLNRVDFRSALIIEDTFQVSPKLADLDISGNPLGSSGMRSLLRLLSHKQSALMHFRARDTGSGDLVGNRPDLQVFEPASPGGRYSLDLTSPYHRSLLRMLYTRCDRVGLSPAEAFSGEGGVTFRHPPELPDGRRDVPLQGKLSFNFSVEEAHRRELRPDSDVEAVLLRRLQLSRVSISSRKRVPFLALWKSIEGMHQEQVAVLEALARDFLLPYTHLDYLCRCEKLIAETVSRLLPCLTGGRAELYLSTLLCPALSDFIQVTMSARTLLHFCPENPTGHYELRLENPVDYAVMDRLAMLDCWEMAVKAQNKRMDISQFGNQSHMRNLRHDGKPLFVPVISDWRKPDVGILRLDYTSSRRAQSAAPTLDEDTFTTLASLLSMRAYSPLDEMSKDLALPPEVSRRSQLQALRQVSPNIYITARQLRTLIGTWSEQEARTECLIVLLNRVVDIQNEKLFRVRLDPETLSEIHKRLGFANYFPFIQPEQSDFTLNLAHHDQRVAANMLVILAFKEGTQNLRKPQLTRADGTIDPLALGVPRSWEDFRKMPQDGVFSVTYVCAPENRHLKTRRQWFERYGNYPDEPEEESVMWWAALTDVPGDVLEYLEFVTYKYKDVASAFRALAGHGGQSQLPLRKFVDGVRASGCKKFQGPNEEERIREIFRYLDPGGEGQISVDEWGVLELFWKEIDLAIREFVEFCERHFGDDLQDAWDEFDEDKSGTLTQDEWLSTLRASCFFGPAQPIFDFLDTDDEGTISAEEFAVLAKFQRSREARIAAQEKKQRALRAARARVVKMQDFEERKPSKKLPLRPHSASTPDRLPSKEQRRTSALI